MQARAMALVWTEESLEDLAFRGGLSVGAVVHDCHSVCKVPRVPA
eukprot:CAMPEP_0118990070 /NCGR_PEP_ID=MMETSP1173-20130426/49183_1 /TAXON_ID=1034831 /ORGANISM="Rhizochromulina marina cf, Strain CCMP1243" /LENGTH=44 /DNA_ID= /DNA_START= /DNA_END= /DNA_ORIENTATION=